MRLVTKISGSSGKSAYEIAVEEGFEGTQQEWLESLKGKDGAKGADGKDGINGVDGKDGAKGKDGVNGKDGANGENAPNITGAKATVDESGALVGLELSLSDASTVKAEVETVKSEPVEPVE